MLSTTFANFPCSSKPKANAIMKTFFQAYLGSLVAGITLFFLGFLLILASGMGSKDNSIPSGSILKIDLSGVMQDHVPNNAFPFMDELLGRSTVLSMEDIVFNIEKAGRDPQIEAIYLNFDFFTTGTPQLREIRQALEAFKESGKTVYAFGQVIDRQAYYLASTADSLILSPVGVMEWTGIASSQPYLKGVLDKIGVEIQLIRGRDNAYKSAGEPFIATEMSDSNRAQISSYINSVWNEIIKDVAGDGRVSEQTLNDIAATGGLLFPADALDLGLIDAIAHEDEVLAFFAEDPSNPDFDNLNFVSLGKYKNTIVPSEGGSLHERIAVVYAEGDVSIGKSSSGVMGAETIIEALREVRTNDDIAAVVLRVNSPGGLSLAGDAMWREVQLTAEAKPLVVSMGNVAASAGYLISAPADYIMVQPQTITGSIGVFAMFPIAEGLLHDKLGVNFETVATHEMAGMGVPDRPLTEAEYALLQNNVDVIYNRFRDAVASGRDMDRAAVDKLAKGRVWTGVQAIENGLADGEGGLVDAIEKAKELAGIEGPARRSTYPQVQDPLTEWLNSMQATSKVETLKAEMGPLYPLYNQWSELQNMMGFQQRLVDYSMHQPL
ncbi:MAG: signal peptide peptidase SppA [Bacteroidetes bacterium]|nr:MAG: signal peptide peptidase SppA [Bacteroidota bacterium]